LINSQDRPQRLVREKMDVHEEVIEENMDEDNYTLIKESLPFSPNPHFTSPP
jgi:hypothetical protein